MKNIDKNKMRDYSYNRIYKILLISLLIVATNFSLFAQPYKGGQKYSLYTNSAGEVVKGHDWEIIKNNPQLVWADYLPYPVVDSNPQSIPNLTKAPKGYKPFYISHYGRHGSRWLIQTRYYTAPLEFLEKAHNDGALTPLGEDLLKRLRITNAAALSRYGELTPLGAEQHREIAGRMYKNFPEVFLGNVEVDARSTVVIRCILSMDAFCQRLKELNPTLQIKNDASYYDMAYMNYQDPENYFRKIKDDREKSAPMYEFRAKTFKTDRLVNSILKDPGYFNEYNLNKDSLDNFQKFTPNQLFYYIAQQAINLPNTPLRIRLNDIITLEELYQVYLYRNVNSYFYAGWDNHTDNLMPYTQTNLLKNIIATADAQIASGERGVTLRFGHDSNVLPLCALMNIDGAGVHIENYEDLADNWAMYHYIPKAANLQFIFYKNPKDNNAPIILKVLLNEHEAVLPVPTTQYPYYKWSDFKDFYENILKDSPANSLKLR